MGFSQAMKFDDLLRRNRLLPFERLVDKASLQEMEIEKKDKFISRLENEIESLKLQMGNGCYAMCEGGTE